ncbi:MAG: SMP-30/gluconolactonase/LRE family protein [Chloroflexi bacterium]|nr:SMP-30/gluconolactonase/LRE family protein [Chloroflexota bacterium]
MPILNNDTQVSVLVDGLDHPEGVAWGLDGYAYAGGEMGQIYRVDVDAGEFRQIAQITPAGFIGGLALDGNNNIYACDAAYNKVRKITPGGLVTTYSEGAPGEPFNLPNYPAFDSQGSLYVSSSGGWYKDAGLIYKVKAGGETEVWERTSVTFPNGICLSPSSEYLYVVMSLNPPRVSRIRIEADGSAGDVELVTELPETVPDGLAFDTDGNLYISCYRPDRIYRLAVDGGLQVLADDFEGTLIAAPTNVAFCGRDRDILISANLGRWHLTRYEVGATGVQLHYPKLD